MRIFRIKDTKTLQKPFSNTSTWRLESVFPKLWKLFVSWFCCLFWSSAKSNSISSAPGLHVEFCNVTFQNFFAFYFAWFLTFKIYVIKMMCPNLFNFEVQKRLPNFKCRNLFAMIFTINVDKTRFVTTELRCSSKQPLTLWQCNGHIHSQRSTLIGFIVSFCVNNHHYELAEADL